MLSSAFRSISPTTQAVLIVLLVCLVLFGLSRFSQPPEKIPNYGPRAAARMRAIVLAVQQSYANAVRARDVHRQLLHVHWAMAMLETVRTLAADDAALSKMVGTDVVKLDATLRRAEATCVSVMEKSAPKKMQPRKNA